MTAPLSRLHASPPSLLAPALTSALLFALYWWTLAPSISELHDNVDSAELITVASVDGVAHPPGSAIWLPLGHVTLNVLSFIDEPAMRTNLLSAVCMALAGGVMALAIVSWRPGTPPWAAMLGGILGGVAPIPWAQGLVTEVLAPQALLTALAIWLAPSAARGRRWPAFALVLGLMAWNHPTGLAIAVPLAAACLVQTRPRRGDAVLAVVLFLVPAGFTVAYLWLRNDAPIAWGDTSSASGIWAHLTGNIYQDVIDRSPAPVLEASPETLRRLFRQLPIPAWILVVPGVLALGQQRPRLGIALAASCALLIVFVSAYRATGRQDYLTPVVFIASMCAAYGAVDAWRWLRGQLRRQAVVLAAAVGVAGLVAVWVVISGDAVTRRGDTALRDEAVARLEMAEAGAVIQTGRDEETFSLWYAQVVLGVRPDVTIEDTRGLAPIVGPRTTDLGAGRDN